VQRWETMTVVAGAALALLASSSVRASVPGYTITAPVRITGAYEGRNIPQVGDLNNKGQFTFNLGGPEHIHVWDGTQVLVLSGPSIEVPGQGPFTEGNVWSPHGINDNGVVTWIGDFENGNHVVLTYDLNTKQYTVIAAPGSPAPGGGEYLNAVSAGPSHRQQSDINNKGQVAFNAQVAGADGEPRHAIFMYDPATKETVAIVRPGAAAPGGGAFDHAWTPQINNLSQVTFVANLEGSTQYGVYRWEAGNFTAIAVPGQKVGEDTIDQTGYARLADNGDISFVAHFGEGHSHFSEGTTDETNLLLYTAADQKLQVLLKPGDKLPDGKTFKGVELNRRAASVNSKGQVAVLAVREEDGRAGLYLWQNGTWQLVAGYGDTIPGVGEVTGMGKTTPDKEGNTWDGYHMAINDNGDIAFTAQIDGVGAFLLAKAPAPAPAPDPAPAPAPADPPAAGN
jgi:hypothetical protein